MRPSGVPGLGATHLIELGDLRIAYIITTIDSHSAEVGHVGPHAHRPTRRR
jgi:hypothetical protein